MVKPFTRSVRIISFELYKHFEQGSIYLESAWLYPRTNWGASENPKDNPCPN